MLTRRLGTTLLVLTAALAWPVSPAGADGPGAEPEPIVATAAAAPATATGPDATDVHAHGAARSLGSRDGENLRAPVEAIAATPSGEGYWLATATGEITAYGDAAHHGDLTGVDLAYPVVGFAPTATGDGYWLAATDGGIFAFGDARFFGSMGGVQLNEPVVGMAPTPSGLGYWMVASDGGIFAFGEARFHGSMGGLPLNQPIVGMAATARGRGYWMVAADGGMFSFGDARFFGSTGGTAIDAPVEAMRPTPDGDGYWLAGLDGAVYPFGAADDFGSSLGLEGVVSDIAVRPQGDGYWLAEADLGDTVSVWQSRGFDGPVLAGVQQAAVSAGAAHSVLYTGTIGMLALHRGAAVVQAATPGWRIPMTALAVDAEEALARFGPHVSTAMLRGEVVMGERTARLRGARVGDTLVFVGWDGAARQRRIGAIAPALRAGSTELLFSLSDAATFGFNRPSSALLWGFESRDSALAAIERDVAHPPYFVVSPSWNPRMSDEILPTVGLKELLGEFQYLSHGNGAITIDPDWVARNIRTAMLPIIGSITCNRAAIDQMAAALAELQASGLAPLVNVADTRSAGGCWVPREVAGATGGSISRHGWGVAIDINPSSNPFGGVPTIDMRIVDIFRRHGFAWGGTWTRPDGMHFEWTGPLE